MKKYKNTIIYGSIIIVALVVVFIWGNADSAEPAPFGAQQPAAGATAASDSAAAGAGETSPPEPGIVQNQPVSNPPEQNMPGQSLTGQGDDPVSPTPGGPQDMPSQPPGGAGSAQPPQAEDERQGNGAGQGGGAGEDSSTGQGDTAGQDSGAGQQGGNQQGGGTGQDGNQQGGDPDETEAELTATLIVDCSTILNNLGRLRRGMAEFVPADGMLLNVTAVFYEGESVFNVLLREIKVNRMHIEFVNIPLYNSAYIEGIGNIYEFDCGEGSGWMYSVNGEFPNYGSSRYVLSDGDVIMWLYTCDRGLDIGGGDAAEFYGFG